uniref:Uncharacterized protein n=1 Tax=Ditylenchus dipsaci TaxID=166011 RepID=A0A915EKP3_9BILA
MALNVDGQWLARVLDRVEQNNREIQGQLTKTNRGKECLVVNGYEYKKEKSSAEEKLRVSDRREVIATVKKSAVTGFGSSANAIVSSAKGNSSDFELLSLPTNRALQDKVQQKKKPIGANSVDRVVNEIVWLDYFVQTERGDIFLRHDSRY